MRHALVVAASLAALLAVPARARSPVVLGGAGPETRSAVARSSPASVSEIEPNNSPATATPIALGDAITGAIDPAGDVDFFALDLTAGTVVVVAADYSPLDPVVAILGPDSVTVVAGSESAVVGSYLSYYVPASGRYFIRLADYLGAGGGADTYVLRVSAVAPGPGDPARVVAAGLGRQLSGLAVSATGDLYTADVLGHRVLRVTPAGAVSVFATTGTAYPFDVVFDGYGNLLVTVSEYVNFGCVDGQILRLTPGGERTVLADLHRLDVWAAGSLPIGVGPNGNVYVIGERNCTTQDERGGPYLFRFDPSGLLRDSVNLVISDTCWPYPTSLAWSPQGELFYGGSPRCGGALYKLAASGPVEVISWRPGSPLYVHGLAFDQDGYVYVADEAGAISLFDPSSQPIATPFAVSNLISTPALRFGRDGTGAMTARLFAVTSAGGGSIVELNPSAIRAPGFRVGVDLLRLTITPLRDGAAGSDYADTLKLENPLGSVTWTFADGLLPPGLKLEPASGAITGVPQDSGRFLFAVRGASGGRFGVGTLTIAVSAPTVKISAAADPLLGGTPLAPDVQRYLDLRGNRNGRFDAGDLRALVAARAQHSPRPTPQTARSKP